jgi:hypothetical protein
MGIIFVRVGRIQEGLGRVAGADMIEKIRTPVRLAVFNLVAKVQLAVSHCGIANGINKNSCGVNIHRAEWS